MRNPFGYPHDACSWAVWISLLGMIGCWFLTGDLQMSMESQIVAAWVGAVGGAVSGYVLSEYLNRRYWRRRRLPPATSDK